MRLIDADALKESLKESRDNCSLWLQDCKEAKSQKWIGRAEQALMTFNECLMRIDTIPTIESERRTGKWISQAGGGYCCSKCGRYALHDVDGKFALLFTKSKYCPNCGASMEVEDEAD